MINDWTVEENDTFWLVSLSTSLMLSGTLTV